MEQKKKNIRLLVILLLLIIMSIGVQFIHGNKSSTTKNVRKFQLEDTTGITSVTIKSMNFENDLQKTDSGWTINGKYLADESMIIVLFSVMQNVEILREIDMPPAGEDSEEKEEIYVEFRKGTTVVQSFSASSNSTKTRSVFTKDGESYIVNLPGYDSFVTGIFEIPESDWRNRLIVSLGPLNMEGIKINYLKDPAKSFEIKVENNFPYITDVAELDTIMLMDYLDQFNYFQVDQFITPDVGSELDSISRTEPWITFYFEEMNSTNNVTLSFFHKKSNAPTILARLNDQQLVLFNFRRIASIFKEKRDFIAP